MIPQAREINGRPYVPVMNNQILDDVDIVEIRGKKPKKLMFINGKIRDVSKRCDYKTDELGWVKDDSINPVVVYLEKVINKDTNRKSLHLILHGQDGEIGRARLCYKQSYELAKIVLKLFGEYRPPIIPDDLDVPKEVLVWMVLLQSDTYMFTKKDLIKLGIVEVTAKHVIRSMLKRNLIYSKSNKGREKFYSGTMPREDLINYFSNKDEWRERKTLNEIMEYIEPFDDTDSEESENTEFTDGYNTAMRSIIKIIESNKPTLEIEQ